MKKTILLRIISCVLFLSLVLYPGNSLVYWAEGNIFTRFFAEPSEISYVIFYDGQIFKFTSYEEHRVNLSYYQFKEVLKEKGRKIEDIAIKIHNHLVGGGFNFSSEDKRFYRMMKEDGFEGSYCLRLPTGKIKYQRDKNVALMQFLKKKEVKEFLKKYKEEYPEAHKELIRFIKKVKK